MKGRQSMKKTELINDLKQYTGGGVITRKQLAGYMSKKDPHGVDRYLFGLQRIDGKYYFIPDVADSLIGR